MLNEESLKFTKSLGIPRHKMPQIQSSDINDFIKWISKKGVNSKTLQTRVNRLKPTQDKYNSKKVEKLMSNSNYSLGKKIIASSDFYIVDGHHRFLALKMKNKNANIQVIKFDVPIRKLLDYCNQYPKSFKKSINESDLHCLIIEQ